MVQFMNNEGGKITLNKYLSTVAPDKLGKEIFCYMKVLETTEKKYYNLQLKHKVNFKGKYWL